MVLFWRVGQLFPISFSNVFGPQPLDDALMSFDECYKIRLKSSWTTRFNCIGYGKGNLLSHNAHSTAAHIPPGRTWRSMSAGQYGCVSAGLYPMGCNCDPNGPNMDRDLGLHILSHSAHIGVHGDPVVSHWDPIPHPSECTWDSFGSQLRPIQHPSGDRVPIRIAIASHSAPTGVYESQFLTSQKS